MIGFTKYASKWRTGVTTTLSFLWKLSTFNTPIGGNSELNVPTKFLVSGSFSCNFCLLKLCTLSCLYTKWVPTPSQASEIFKMLSQRFLDLETPHHGRSQEFFFWRGYVLLDLREWAIYGPIFFIMLTETGGREALWLHECSESSWLFGGYSVLGDKKL